MTQKMGKWEKAFWEEVEKRKQEEQEEVEADSKCNVCGDDRPPVAEDGDWPRCPGCGTC